MKIKNVLFLTLLLTIVAIFIPNVVNAGTGDEFIENELKYKIITEDTVEVSGYLGAPTIVTIPKTVIYDGKTYNVISIGDKAFWECTSITNVTIQDTVTTIGERAFYKCSALESVTIPNSVETIKDGAFQICKELTTIEIPFGVTKIGGFMFDQCEALTSVTIPDSITIIETHAFYGCKVLVNINIPDSVKIIEDRAFAYCDSLTIKMYNVINNLTNISNERYNYALPESKDYETTLSAKKGYKLPKNIRVKIDEYDLSINDYEYNSETGNLKISADIITGNIEIEAMAEKIYKISFDANGGEFSNGKDALIYEDAEDFDYYNLEQPTRKGYEFVGYYNEDEKSLEDIMNSEAGIDDDMTFYAKWEEKEVYKEATDTIDTNKNSKDEEQKNIGNDGKEEGDLNNPKTGDNILVFVGLFIASAMGIIVTTKLKKNYKNK